jgi:hypothetical protein
VHVSQDLSFKFTTHPDACELGSENSTLKLYPRGRVLSPGSTCSWMKSKNKEKEFMIGVPINLNYGLPNTS